MNKVAKIAKDKIQRFQDRSYVGYLTPVEVLYLISIGCKPQRDDIQELCEIARKSGIARSMWVYFDEITFFVGNKKHDRSE